MNDNQYETEELLNLIDSTDIGEIPALFEALSLTLPERIQSVSHISMILERINSKHEKTELKNKVIWNFFTTLDEAAKENENFCCKNFVSSLLKNEKNHEILFQLLLNFSTIDHRVNFIKNYFDNLHHDFIKSFDYLIYFLEKLLDDTGDRLMPEQFKCLFLNSEKTRAFIEENYDKFRDIFASIYTDKIGDFLILFNKELLSKIALDFDNLKKMILFFIEEEDDDKTECSNLVLNMLSCFFSRINVKIINNHLKNNENMSFMKMALIKNDLKKLNKKFKFNLFHEEKKCSHKPVAASCSTKRKIQFSEKNETRFFKRFDHDFSFIVPLQQAIFITSNEVGIDYNRLELTYSDRDWRLFSRRMSDDILTIINTHCLPESSQAIDAEDPRNNNNRHGYTSILLSSHVNQEMLASQRQHLATFFYRKIIGFLSVRAQDSIDSPSPGQH